MTPPPTDEIKAKKPGNREKRSKPGGSENGARSRKEGS